FQQRFPTYKSFVRISIIMQDATKIFWCIFNKGLSSFLPDDLQIFINLADGVYKRVSVFIRMPDVACLFRIQGLEHNMVLLIAGKKKYEGKWTEYKTYFHQLAFVMVCQKLYLPGMFVCPLLQDVAQQILRIGINVLAVLKLVGSQYVLLLKRSFAQQSLV